MVSFKKIFYTALMASTALALPRPLKRDTSGNQASAGKRGAAYNDASAVKALDVNGGVSWSYNWSPIPGGILPDGVEFVPMLWGQKAVTQFISAIAGLLTGGDVKYMMGFNEPDISNQAAMATSEAINLFKQLLTPHSGRVALVSPAVTNSQQQGQGLSWLEDFLGGCSDCGMSVVAVHWYGNDADDFKKFVQQAVDLANQHGMREVWVTEMALSQDSANQGSGQESADFIRQVLPWLDSQTMVTRYAYFYAEENYLVKGGQPSEAGWAYLSS